MILIETLYLRVKDIAKNDKGGYSSSDEFNRDIANAQSILFEYYFSMFERGQQIPDSFMPFITSAKLGVDSEGFVELPSDYRHRLEVNALVTSKPVCGDEPVFSEWPTHYLHANEVGMTRQNGARKPSLAKRRFYHTFEDGKLRVLPSVPVRMKYLKSPAVALRGYTVNITTFEEDYNDATTVNLEWPEQEETNFVDLLLFFKGIQTRETELISWVQAKKGTYPAQPIFNQ